MALIIITQSSSLISTCLAYNEILSGSFDGDHCLPYQNTEQVDGRLGENMMVAHLSRDEQQEMVDCKQVNAHGKTSDDGRHLLSLELRN